MKVSKNLLELCSISVVLIFSIGMTARAQTAQFYPNEGTSSIYRWNFTEFPNICILNISDDNPNEFDNFVCLDNPTYAEFSVSYRMSNLFLKEEIEGSLYNSSLSLNYKSYFLINTSSREYVDERGENSDTGYANGYIDPRNLSIGALIMVGNSQVEIVAKEVIDITGSSREAWKLESNSNDFNQTFHYDVITGILLKAKLVTVGGTIGRAAGINDLKQAVSSREQILISTNAWDSVQVTTSASFAPVLGLLIVMIITRKKK